MIAPRPVAPSTTCNASPALKHTRTMAALLRKYLYRDFGPGKGEHIVYRAPMPIPENYRSTVKRSTLGQRFLSHTAGLLVLYTYALVILVNGGWKLGLSKEERERRRRLAISECTKNSCHLWNRMKLIWSG